eukprot:gene28828-37835_t
MTILRSILVFVLAQGIYGDSDYSAEQSHLHLLDVFTYAKNRFNLSSSMQISDAVEVIASATGSTFVSSRPSSGIESNGNLQPSATIPSGISKPNNFGLSGDCLNKLCLMMEYALTCKAIGLGFKKICAQYFLGAYYGCPMFPPSSAIYDAPSICLPEIFGLLADLSSGELTTIVSNYLNPSTFQTNACGRRCFQNYQFASNDFYYSCGTQLSAAHGYNVTTELFMFQTFRNQACTYYEKNGQQYNCYSQLTTIVPSPPTAPSTPKPSSANSVAPTISSSSQPTFSSTAALQDFNCTFSLYPPSSLTAYNYGTYNSYAYKYNALYSAKLCQQFAALQCCAANDVTMAEQSTGQVLPPCLYNYFKTNCTALNFQNYCPLGAIANVTTVQASITLLSKPVPVGTSCTPMLPFLNMYTKHQVLILQTLITTALQLASNGSLNDDPYNFNPLVPVQVQIVGFTYYKYPGGKNALTPSNGSTYYPPQGDYELAASAKYVFQLVAQNLNPAQAANLTKAVTSKSFLSVFQSVFCQAAPTVSLLSPTNTTIPQPLVLPSNSAGKVTLTSLIGAAVALLVSVHFLLQ